MPKCGSGGEGESRDWPGLTIAETFVCATGSDPLDLLGLSVAKRYCVTFGNGDRVAQWPPSLHLALGLPPGCIRQIARKTLRQIIQEVTVWLIGFHSLAQHKREAGWHTTAEISAQFHVHPQTLKRYAYEGVLNARRVDDKGQILSRRSMDRRPNPVTEDDCAISVVTPNLLRTCAKRCSMKL